MLGINSSKEPITGEFARTIADTAFRIFTGNLNDEDRRIIRNQVARKRNYTVRWV